MIFVFGPLYAGKQEFITRALGWNREDFEARAVRDAHLLPDGTESPEDLAALADTLAKKQVVLADEVGGGVVPMDPEERKKREAAGRLSCLLAERADCVVRVCMGLPQILKGDLPR